MVTGIETGAAGVELTELLSPSKLLTCQASACLIRNAALKLRPFFRFYTDLRPHSSLKGKTPKEFAESMAGLS